MTLRWNGKRVFELLSDDIGEGMVDWGIQDLEPAIDSELYPGHGYDTGTMERGTHVGPAHHNYGGENVPAAPGTPDRRGRRYRPQVSGNRISGSVGSGQSYAMIVHQGGNGRHGLHFITDPVQHTANALVKRVQDRVRKRRG